MHKVWLVLASIACAGIAHASISYQVDASFTGSGFTTSSVTTALTVGGETLTLVFTPFEPSGPVSSPTNTTWGSLFLSLSGNNSSRSYDLSALTLTLELIDLDTGGFVTEVGSFSGASATTAGGLLTSTTGNITWSPQGTQLVPPPSTTTFTTDNSDPIGNNVSPQPSTTVNGTVASTAVPEPATFGLMGVALLGLGVLARKRKV